jgi:uncharacterized protein with HEPN domain
MPLDPDDAAPLADMLRYAQEVSRRVRNATFEQFLGNDDFRLATERRIEIIGEAARRVSSGFREEHPDIPWRSIIAQRHILAHEYGEVIESKIWRVATIHIPALVDRLVPLVPPPPSDL